MLRAPRHKSMEIPVRRYGDCRHDRAVTPFLAAARQYGNKKIHRDNAFSAESSGGTHGSAVMMRQGEFRVGLLVQGMKIHRIFIKRYAVIPRLFRDIHLFDDFQKNRFEFHVVEM